MAWLIKAIRIAINAAASVATQGRAICQSSIGPSSVSRSTPGTGHKGASAINR